jgi:hypothetical protein
MASPAMLPAWKKQFCYEFTVLSQFLESDSFSDLEKKENCHQEVDLILKTVQTYKFAVFSQFSEPDPLFDLKKKTIIRKWIWF